MQNHLTFCHVCNLFRETHRIVRIVVQLILFEDEIVSKVTRRKMDSDLKERKNGSTKNA